ncbi:hypothetical protein V8E52_006068 [Russula decolorans]
MALTFGACLIDTLGAIIYSSLHHVHGVWLMLTFGFSALSTSPHSFRTTSASRAILISQNRPTFPHDLHLKQARLVVGLCWLELSVYPATPSPHVWIDVKTFAVVAPAAPPVLHKLQFKQT